MQINNTLTAMILASFTMLTAVAAVRHAVLGKEHERVTICHVPGGTPTTMDVPAKAVDGHLHHGDTVGPCEGSSSSPSPPPPSSPEHQTSTTGGGEPRAETAFATFRGSGIGELAAVTHATLARYGLHANSPYKYTFHHENIRPATFASHEAATDWTLREHAACCSMYRYLVRLRAERPYIKPGYIDWLTDQLARALDEDPNEIRAALLGLPHDHPHTSAAVRSLTGEGCAEQTYRSSPSGRDESGRPRSTHAEHIQEASSTEELLTVEQKDIPGEIAFVVMDGEAVFTDYGVSHTKDMHLLIVRNDLRHFQHVHPERDAAGVWHVPFTAPAGGTYWVYADFIGADDRAHTIRFERAVDADPGESGLQKSASLVQRAGKYTVRLAGTSYASGMLFTVRIRDERNRDTPFLEEYLGAAGHAILISADGSFIHTHPSPAGDTLVFHTPVLHHDFYRIFTQFKIQDELLTVEFDWGR